MTQSNYQLRLQASLLNEVRRLAAKEGASVNQFINVAVAEKLSALRTAAFFRERGRRADVDQALAVLDRLGTEPPRSGDEIKNRRRVRRLIYLDTIICQMNSRQKRHSKTNTMSDLRT